ncbi:MAG TPA: aminotransferase class I/II-fold pyridoxal phosphate-dependent enzyme [Solirubrobacteraceae bacterium]|nr:aminotransferase class I/II-fold pyridoxal phosphate-dependent enzyme [Solirubrobacteraceae bacterium]
MIEIGARLSELEALGLSRRTRLVSGPQGPRVVLDGKPTLVLCSANYLGLADHPRVREAAAEAAMRWGAGAGGSRLSTGTMTVHRRLEERLAEFLARPTALLFGSGYLAAAGVLGALARPGDVVFLDELCPPALLDGCRLAGAETFVYDHLDVDHLRWGIAKAEGRGALIATESVFSLGGDVAPMAEIVELAQRRRLRLLVDESHALGAVGAGGEGVLRHEGLEDEVDVALGSLGTGLGSYGAFVVCRRQMAEHLLNAARTLLFSSALPPSAAAAALAALGLLEQRPQLAQKLRLNASVLRRELEREGFGAGGQAQIVSVFVGSPELAERLASAALEQGILVEAIRPPAVPSAASFLRLTPMASHRPEELQEAAGVLLRAAHSCGFEPAISSLPAEVLDFELESERRPVGAGEIAPRRGVFDVEALEPPQPDLFDVESSDRLAA